MEFWCCVAEQEEGSIKKKGVSRGRGEHLIALLAFVSFTLLCFHPGIVGSRTQISSKWIVPSIEGQVRELHS